MRYMIPTALGCSSVPGYLSTSIDGTPRCERVNDAARPTGPHRRSTPAPRCASPSSRAPGLSARRGFSRPGDAVLPIAACRPRSKRGGPSPACTLRKVRRRKVAAYRGGPVEPFERVLEIAQTRVGVGAIEARLDHLLVAYLARYALVPPPIVSRLVREVGDSTRPPIVFRQRGLAGRSGTAIPLVVTRTSVARPDAGWSTRRGGGHAPLLERRCVSSRIDTLCRPGAGADGRPPFGWSEARSKRNTDQASGYTRFVRAGRRR